MDTQGTPLRSPLHEEHLSLNASMTEFGGYLMPVQYSGIIPEHLAVRKAAGLFDTSHMGEFLVKGRGAEGFLQGMLTNDVRKCVPGTALYTAMCLPSGGTVDDLYIYNITGMGWPSPSKGEAYMLVVNAANTAKDLTWLTAALKGVRDATLTDVSAEVAMIALQGPKAEAILHMLTKMDCAGLRRFSTAVAEVAGARMLVSRTGYTGEDGFELYFSPKQAGKVWRAILDAGKPHGLLPAGLGSRDTLRLEACYPLYGHELDERTSPVEGGIGWAVSEKDILCMGCDVLLKEKKEGARRELVAFEMRERAIPRKGYPLLVAGRIVGEVTSGTHSPLFNKGIGLALAERGTCRPGDAVTLTIRERDAAAVVVKKPFYAYAGRDQKR